MIPATLAPLAVPSSRTSTRRRITVDLQPLIALVVGIAAIVVIVLRTRLDAFIALLIAALLTGSIAGFAPTDTISPLVAGFGSPLGSIGRVIGLGVAGGKVHEISDAADALAG